MQRKAQKKNKEFILRKVDAARFAKNKNEGQKKSVCPVYFDYIDFDIYILFIYRLTRIYIKIIIACRQRWFENFKNE